MRRLHQRNTDDRAIDLFKLQFDIVMHLGADHLIEGHVEGVLPTIDILLWQPCVVALDAQHLTVVADADQQRATGCVHERGNVLHHRLIQILVDRLAPIVPQQAGLEFGLVVLTLGNQFARRQPLQHRGRGIRRRQTEQRLSNLVRGVDILDRHRIAGSAQHQTPVIEAARQRSLPGVNPGNLRCFYQTSVR